MKLINYLKFWHLPKKYLAIILILIIGTGFFLYSKNTKKIPIQTAKVERKDIRTEVSSSGTLTGKNTADLRFKTSGKLGSLNVKAGDKVSKGQIIATLDTQALNISLQQAENNFTALDATAKRAEDDIKNHESDENFTQKEIRVKAQTARDSAFDTVKEAQRAFQDATITSPISGIVIKADPLPGQVVTGADVIAQVSDDSGFNFNAEVDETEIGKITIGQPVEVTLNSYPDQIFKGSVSEITPSTFKTDSGGTAIIVKIDLGTPTINFVSGLSGQASIILQQNSNVLVIPQEALLEDNSVYVKNGQDYQKVQVQTGLRSDTEVEILSGLSENQEIATNPDAIKNK